MKGLAFRDLFNTLKVRLLIGSAVPLVLFLAVLLVGWIVFQWLIGALAEEKRSGEVAIMALQQKQKLDARHQTVETAAKKFQAPLPSAYTLLREEFLDRLRRLRELVGDQPEQARHLQAIQSLEEEWHALVQRYFQTRASRLAAGPGFQQEVQQFAHRSAEGLRRLDAEMTAFSADAERLLSQRREETRRQAWQGGLVIAVASALAVILTIVGTFQSAHSVSRPLQHLRRAAAQLPAGRVELVSPEGPTEIAELIVHFNHMAMTLAERVSSLQAKEERYRTYLGAVAHILWTADARGEVNGDLPGWCAFTGQTTEEIQGIGWLTAVHPDDHPDFTHAWEAAVAARTPFEAECRLRATDGSYRPFACRAVPLLTLSGEVREWIGTCTDISVQKQQAELRQAKEAAEARNRAKTQFLARMSHELRTPLNAVIGMSRLLTTQRFGPLNVKQLDYLNDVTQAGEHLLALVNNLLDLTRVEAGRMEVRSGSFDLSAAMTVLGTTLRPLAESRGVSLSVEPPIQDGPLHTDAARFRQVLSNLLSNAIKFTPPGGRVVVRCQWVATPHLDSDEADVAQAQAVRLAVSDTGVGIAAQDQEAVWEEFRQLRAPIGEEVKGTGLGLSLTQRLVALLGGEIALESQPGLGSTFTFVLPRRAPPSPLSDPQETADPSNRGRCSFGLT